MEIVIFRHSSLPGWLKAFWLCCSPLALAFAARVLWEKTVWTWTRGPQAVGFSLLHIHPGFAIIGVLCCLGLFAWLVVAFPFLIARRKNIRATDLMMVSSAVFVAAAIMIPDTLFA
ncbi:MAG TPA: hypothetical protein VD837_06365 [Terriglobales bacterium]|nr:hypothetical protein [Terriglobales bacterium]